MRADMSAPQFPTDHGYPEESQATMALVLGILGVMTTVLAPIAWIIANREIEGIQAGRRSPEGMQLASTARILGIVGSVLFLLAFVLLLFVVALLGVRSFA